MAVDHGLGGKESDKSKIRRERKAKRLRSLTRSLQNKDLVGSAKKEVVFDENARVAFLTGFHKRKQERRKYGLTMQVLKEKKQRKEILKSRNLVLVEQKENAKRNKDIPMPESDNDDDEDAGKDDQGSLADEASVFEDDATVSMFGSAVSVVVSDNIGGEDEDEFGFRGPLSGNNDSDDDEEEGSDNEDGNGSVVSRLSTGSQQSWMKYKGEKKKQKQISNFERAMKKVSQTFGQKKKKNNAVKAKNVPRDMRKKVESQKLLTKYLGTKGLSAKKRRK